MELRREVLTTEILDPRRDFAPMELTLEIRWDPLTGHTSRILPSAGLLQPAKYDLPELAEQTRAGCPFCAERIEETTPKLPSSVAPEGRIRRGEAVLFPNLLPYSRHSAVSVYSPKRHFLPLGEMSAELIADNLATQVEFARAVMRADEAATWASVNREPHARGRQLGLPPASPGQREPDADDVPAPARREARRPVPRLRRRGGAAGPPLPRQQGKRRLAGELHARRPGGAAPRSPSASPLPPT
jgi:hypothetical protein